jgi:hypothetical protein
MLSEHRVLLLSLFESLQRLRAAPYGRTREGRGIQNTLIKQITAAEGRIQNSKQIVASLRKQLSTPQPLRPTKARAQETKEAIAFHSEGIEAEERLIDILRDVGDGLAFIYIDKWDIKPMAFKEAPGYLSGKEGLSAELAIFNRAFDQGGIAILNDLTHCLRYGDVTLISEGAAAIVEAKSGRTLNQRGKRQQVANDMICGYLQTDRVVGLYGYDHEFHRVGLAHPEMTHASTLETMIWEATERAGSYRQIEPGLHYMVDADEDISGFKMALQSVKGQPQVCMVNMLKRDNTAYYPFTLSITNPEHLYDFYNGEFVIIIAVELDYVSRYFKDHGFTATYLHDDPWFITAVTDGASGEDSPALKISAHFWGRLYAEFLSLDWLLTEIASKYARLGHEKDVD